MKVRRHHSKVPWVLKKVMLFTKLPYSKIEGTMKKFNVQMFVSYQTAEKFNVEMIDPPQCHGRLIANIWFSPMLVSVRTPMPIPVEPL